MNVMNSSLGDLTRAGDKHFSLKVVSSLKKTVPLKTKWIEKHEYTFSLMGMTKMFAIQL